ncbi:MAG: SUMF1/EgtB/PvdO family nonheme iron enzyme [Nitrospirae bacterium]|nr:SUMF1/EgtB/PvdO family nonheme iron enzyme [Candidatus Troglogloeales bacterium]
MGSIFIKTWFLFIGLIVLIVITAIIMTRPKEDRSIPLKSTGMPITNNMIPIPAGAFMMGSDDGGPNEKPVRRVFLDAYAINQFEITQFQYGEFVKVTRHRPALSRYVKNIEQFNDRNQPAVYISWLDAEAFCGWIGARLPTEAEWEKADQGNIPASSSGNFTGGEDGSAYTAFVGSFKMDRSSYGIYDMAGNAQEWVSDWYDELYYKTAPNQNPRGPSTGDMKVLRGGSWNDSHISGRVTARMKMFPDYRDVTVGFRCAKTTR